MNEIVRDYRDKQGIGYVIVKCDDALPYFWEWHEQGDVDPSTRNHASLSDALYDAADDWDDNGSTGRRGATMRGAATKQRAKEEADAGRS